MLMYFSWDIFTTFTLTCYISRIFFTEGNILVNQNKRQLKFYYWWFAHADNVNTFRITTDGTEQCDYPKVYWLETVDKCFIQNTTQANKPWAEKWTANKNATKAKQLTSYKTTVCSLDLLLIKTREAKKCLYSKVIYKLVANEWYTHKSDGISWLHNATRVT